MFSFIFGVALGCFLGITFKTQVLFVRDWLVTKLKDLRDYLQYKK